MDRRDPAQPAMPAAPDQDADGAAAAAPGQPEFGILAGAMEALAHAMTRQADEQQHQRLQPPPAPPLDTVKIQPYDGSTDVEDFINLFEQLSDMYNWPRELQLAKLKTSLTGNAVDCGRANNVIHIYQALTAKFGITAAEAKRSLLAMRSGQTDRLRELADRIKKLTAIAYRETDVDIQATLALDQFKRCVSNDMSVFMISRPPTNIDDAVQLCSEYAAAGGKSKRHHHAAAAETVPDDDHTESVAMVLTTKTKTNDDLYEKIDQLQQTMSTLLKGMSTACTDAVRKEMKKSTNPNRVHRPPPNSNYNYNSNNNPRGPPSRDRQPPTPCWKCNQMHWYRDCPIVKAEKARASRNRNNNQRPSNNQNSNSNSRQQQENSTGPRQ